MKRRRASDTPPPAPPPAPPPGLVVQRVLVAELVGNPRNARSHSARNLDAIELSLREYGQVEPLVVREVEGKLVLLGGHGRIEVMRRLGWEHADVVVVDPGSELRADRLGLALNRPGELATWDTEALAELLAELDDPDVLVGGLFDDAELTALLNPPDPASPPPPPPPARQWETSAAVEVSDLVAPFPWFGGKSRAAGVVWHALGDVANYVEPFAGSLGVLLARPTTPSIETVNDADGFVVNFWRALKAAPSEVAEHAAWPVSEIDLTSRHLWLVARRPELTHKLEADPEWYDARAAGWWAWGLCCWIGSGWCAGTGPWGVSEAGRVEKRPHLGDAGRGVNKQLPHLGDAGRGVNKQLPHLGDAGMGVNKQLPHLGNAGLGAWLQRLADRLRRVRVTCGDWSRVVTPAVCERHGLTGVLLDPPYPEGWDPGAAYAVQSDAAGLWRDVCASATSLYERGCRVVVCGYEGTWNPPDGWSVRRWHPRKGYARGDARERDVLWCSPNCVPDAGEP